MYLYEPDSTLGHIHTESTPDELDVLSRSPEGVMQLKFHSYSAYDTGHPHFVPPTRSQSGYRYSLVALQNASSIRSQVASAGVQLSRALPRCQRASRGGSAVGLPPVLVWTCLDDSALTVHCGVRDRRGSAALILDDQFPTPDFESRPCVSRDERAPTCVLRLERWNLLNEPWPEFTRRSLAEGRGEAFDWRNALMHSLDVLLEQLSVDHDVEVGDWPFYENQSVLRVSSPEARLAAMALHLLSLVQGRIHRQQEQLERRLKQLARTLEGSMEEVFTEAMQEGCNLMATLARYIHGEGVPLDTALRKLVAKSTILLRRYCELRTAFSFHAKTVPAMT